MSRLKITTPQGTSIGALRYIQQQFNLSVDYGYPIGEVVGGWTADAGYWIYNGKDDWTEVQTALSEVSFDTTEVID